MTRTFVAWCNSGSLTRPNLELSLAISVVARFANQKGSNMSIVVTSWQTGFAWMQTAEQLNDWLQHATSMGYEVKAMSSFEVENRNEVTQFFNVIVQRPAAWADAAGPVRYPE
jgi:hypothetical protein